MTPDSSPQNQPTEPQQVLALILEDPRRQLFDAVKLLPAGHGKADLVKLKNNVRKIIENTIGRSLRKQTSESDPQPVLVDRLVFCWEVLRRFDLGARKLKGDPVQSPHTALAALRTNLDGILGESTFDPLWTVVLRLERLGDQGDHIRPYCALMAGSRSTIASALYATSHPSEGDLHRLAFWLLRKSRDEYIESTEDEPLQVHFPYLTQTLIKELERWTELTVTEHPSLAQIVEDEVNGWLKYCCLEEPSTGDGVAASRPYETIREIVRQYRSVHQLKNRLVFVDRPVLPADAHRELETQIRQWVDDNSTLKDEVQRLKQELSQRPAISSNLPPAPVSPPEPSDDSAARLREAIRVIDSKYSLDTLDSIQLGAESPLSLRAFVAHFFFALRKQGLVPYPDHAEFHLSYDESGLYECSGFEVAPGERILVVVQRKGWALMRDDRLLPIRKARVIKKDTDDDS
jgi:hypothetical protein